MSRLASEGILEKRETGQGWEMAEKEMVRSSVLFLEVGGLGLY